MLWALPGRRVLQRLVAPGSATQTSIAVLGSGHILHASGASISLYEASNPVRLVLTIDLDADVLALATHGRSTVAAATRLGLVILDITVDRPGLA
jgi:hypothetical protein